MATTRIVVPFWPSSADNLSWSSDNLIAVGGGEWIAILVPRLNTKGPNSLTWDSIAHRINLFTSNEIPFSEPLSSVNWSIGEEMSLRHVWRLDWSPPGLARFNTCALAVLHTNHVLVLWECVGQPHIRDRWKRSLIVNHAIQAYYGTTITDDPEIKQVSQRIRSFAWISAVSKKHKSIDRRLDPHVSQREHYLAVSTDGGDIFILRVFSPHDVLTPENHSWKATVVFRQPLSPELPGKHTETLHTGSSTVAGAVDLAFSDWDDQASAKFAYIAGGRLYVCDARHDSSAPSGPRVVLEEPREYPIPTSFDIRGPLKFVPKSFSLMVFGSDVVMNIDTTSASIDEMRSHHLDGRWDNISGLAFTANAEALPTLNLVSHLSTASSATSVLPVSLEDDSDTRETHWHNAIHESKANFSASYDLGTNVQERTWGITTSPLGDIVATCVSMLPSDSPAHVIQSSQRSVVALTTDFQSTEAPFPYYGGRSPPENVSAEIILYGLRQFAERGGKVDGDEDTKEAMRQAVMNTLDVSLPVSVPPLPWAHDDDRDFEMNAEEFQTCLTNIKARFYWEGDMFFQRLDRLTDVVAQRPLKTQLTKDQYYHVATAVLDLPFELCEISPLSRKIGGAFSAVKAKLENTESAVDPAMVDDASFVEECSMCHQDIVLESLRWSRCAGGHQFSRCTLTFLSIMKPGISKSCRICSAIYLKEDALAEFKKIDAGSVKVEGPKEAESMDVGANSPNNDQNGEQRDDDIEPNLSLARLLFAACDVCILCGGKFVA